LPPAVFDDSEEAAAFLMRVPGMLVLVDGYNVTLSTWSDLPIASQRARLIDACAELAARCSAEVLIVFDGAEEPGDLPPAPGRPGVRWRFSPPGVEADDVLLGLVAALDPSRPVTVASSDRRVRDGARDLGANAISTPQLVSALHREQP
jgi:predicted RNA-binding protein with PIN domain